MRQIDAMAPAAIGSSAKGALLDVAILRKLRELSQQPQQGPIGLVAEAGELSRWHALLHHHFDYFAKQSWLIEILPDLQFWGPHRFLRQWEAIQRRLKILHHLHLGSNIIVLMAPQTLSQYTQTRANYLSTQKTLKPHEEVEITHLSSQLQDMGYVEVSEVKAAGEFSWRGMIFDVFALNADFPYRFHFFGETLQKISHFRVDEQVSFENLPEARIDSHFDWDNGRSNWERNAQKLFDHFLQRPADHKVVQEMVREYLAKGSFAGIHEYSPLFCTEKLPIAELISDARMILASDPMTLEYEFDRHKLDRQHQAQKSDGFSLPLMDGEVQCGPWPSFEIKPTASQVASLPMDPLDLVLRNQLTAVFGAKSAHILAELLHLLASNDELNNWVVLIGYRDEEGLKRLRQLFELRGFSYRLAEDEFHRVLAGERCSPGVVFCKGAVQGFHVFTQDRLVYVTDAFLFTEKRAKYHPPQESRKSLREILADLGEIKPGDFVVHVVHGIGKFCGVANIDAGGNRSDFLILEYKGNDRIYLPTDRLDMIQRYSSGEGGAEPALDQLGGLTFNAKKSKARAAAKELADRLLKIYATRSLSEPRVFAPPSETYLKFEADFPFVETEDQLKAMNDIEEDFRSEKLMDRLICGEVGFGKTELAIRAAMRTVLEGHQVMVLVPTTILCFQHYRSFFARMSSYGAEVRQINRFVRSPTIAKTLDEFSDGKIDVLIGTHRLLSKDVIPKDLSLLIVDEEQRFGVGHKERIKELKAAADVLTLSATPIPRTLHLAMLGLRDISLIATPPTDRLPVKTYIAKYSDELIREVVEYELHRGGQVFYVHNRVDDIQEIAGFLAKLLPGVRVAVAHGQMSESSLEEVILEFIEGQYQVLVCTTIIESGIDMPNVNTLIVGRADVFGLAQLHQLRGRVGRSTRQASAYFLLPSFDSVSQDAMKRLEVLGHNQELGAGFAIANYDLEFRGAGNLLGPEQSGHALAVGLQFYTKLLEEEIAILRGKPLASSNDQHVELKLNITAFIPEDYVASESVRLKIYRKIFSLASVEEDTKQMTILVDQFGSLPQEVARLFMLVHIKRILARMSVLQVTRKDAFSIELKVGKLQDEQRTRLLSLIATQASILRMLPNSRLLVLLEQPFKGPRSIPSDENFLGKVISVLEKLELQLNPKMRLEG
jgi:transcription-repair coupling factor (superfamily II helicase)